MSQVEADPTNLTAPGEACPVIDLNRQVRIAAGTQVLTGVALGRFLHPAFYGLAAFIGAGLIFSGITGICGLCHLLALLPWNRR